LSTPCEGKTYCKRYCEGLRLHSKHPVFVGEDGALPTECGLDVASSIFLLGLRQSFRRRERSPAQSCR
jgi:hypothetical protein